LGLREEPGCRAWVINGYSGDEGLALTELEQETPGPGEVRLRIEAAGTVDTVGPDVEGIELGARMCTLPYFYYQRGVSAESVVIDQRYITPAPTCAAHAALTA
jgi:NADPH2:quinone reductase